MTLLILMYLLQCGIKDAIIFYVVSPPERPVTANTKFQIIGGDYTLTTGNNRVFVDNFYVYRLDDVYYYLLDE